MMKFNLLLLSLNVAFLTIAQNSDFVTLKGKQFKLNDQNFYPLTMNYYVDIVHDIQGNYFVAPHHSYYESNHFECENKEECFNDLINDFITIKNIGFNSIRIVGLSFGLIKDQNDIYTSFPAFISKDLDNNILINQVDSSYSNMFDFIEQTLIAADSADLKVQLLVGGKMIDVESFRSIYLNYLNSIALNFSSNSTLYSYDFFNEPLYFDNNTYTKSEICSLVEDWHFAIKNNSPNHLTTIGLATSSEINEWDPGVLKLDFLSFHLYSDNLDVVKSEIKWISEVSRLPWIIGETGFSANTTGVGGQGTLQNQKDFAKATLEMTRDCGGSGYSWWMYKDVYWGDPTMGDFMGLINHQNILKPACMEFEIFDPFINQGQCTTPSNYYNFNNHTNYSVHGIIEDQNLQPITNAVITGWDVNWENSVKTFSNSMGQFTLKSDHQINKIYASSIGSNVYKNENVNGYLSIKLNQHLPIKDITLQNIIIQVYQNEIYEADNSINTFNLSVEGNGVTGGICKINATNVVRLKTGFKSKKGSWTHILNTQVYLDCQNNLDFQQYKIIHDKEFSIKSKYSTESIEKFEIYPNPSNGFFIIKFENDMNVQKIEIINNIGQIIFESSELGNEIFVDLSNNEKGIYIIKLYGINHIYYSKVVYN